MKPKKKKYHKATQNHLIGRLLIGTQAFFHPLYIERE